MCRSLPQTVVELIRPAMTQQAALRLASEVYTEIKGVGWLCTAIDQGPFLAHMEGYGRGACHARRASGGAPRIADVGYVLAMFAAFG